ncbi:MAG: hypothetical protein MZV64_04665 [Ignavibacteriales bacterium]|nr:hypothetical protein [Ignavibacteriales bacterium]
MFTLDYFMFDTPSDPLQLRRLGLADTPGGRAGVAPWRLRLVSHRTQRREDRPPASSNACRRGSAAASTRITASPTWRRTRASPCRGSSSGPSRPSSYRADLHGPTRASRASIFRQVDPGMGGRRHRRRAGVPARTTSARAGRTSVYEAFIADVRRLVRSCATCRVLDYAGPARFPIATASYFLDGGYGSTNSHLSQAGAALFHRLWLPDVQDVLARLGAPAGRRRASPPLDDPARRSGPCVTAGFRGHEPPAVHAAIRHRESRSMASG